MNSTHPKNIRKKLHSLSQHVHENAFHNVDFGSNYHGINGATPVDTMHLLNEGIIRYTLEVIFFTFDCY